LVVRCPWVHLPLTQDSRKQSHERPNKWETGQP